MDLPTEAKCTVEASDPGEALDARAYRDLIGVA